MHWRQRGSSKETEAVGALRNPEPSIQMEGAKAMRGRGRGSDVQKSMKAELCRLREQFTEKSGRPKVFLPCLFFENVHLCV